MKVNLNELRTIIQEIMSEAKKKKEKAAAAKYTAKPAAYGYAEALDFSTPLGAYNLYRSQGAVNWGPMTGPGTQVDNRFHSVNPLAEDLHEQVRSDPWAFLSEIVNPSPRLNVWESIQHWYDSQGLGLGSQTPQGIGEKKMKLSKKNAKKAAGRK